MIFFRLILIFLIVYLLVRGFIRSLLSNDNSSGEKKNDQKINTPEKPKKVSKSIGEYIDYEETRKKD